MLSARERFCVCVVIMCVLEDLVRGGVFDRCSGILLCGIWLHGAQKSSVSVIMLSLRVSGL